MRLKARYLAILTLLSVATAAAANRDPAHALVGQHWSKAVYTESAHPLLKGCRYEGGALIQNQAAVSGFGLTYLDCGGRRLMLLEAVTGRAGNDDVVRILDAITLPVLKRGEDFMENGDCLLRGRDDNYFVAIVRMGTRDRADWKTGVRAAWRTDLAKGRIEPLSTRQIVCEQPTPP